MKNLVGIIFLPGIWILLVTVALLRVAPRIIKDHIGLAKLFAEALLLYALHEFGWWGIAYGIVCIIMFESTNAADEFNE